VFGIGGQRVAIDEINKQIEDCAGVNVRGTGRKAWVVADDRRRCDDERLEEKAPGANLPAPSAPLSDGVGDDYPFRAGAIGLG
jgi:hypothetical protein